jgi:uncharacterized protein (DUF488 family)
MILTIGHSTRPLAEFLQLLETHEVRHLVDVRTLPRSARFPHYNGEALAAALRERGIGYTHIPDLGGLRRPRPDSPNRGLRNEGFRGFADHMETAAFAAGLAELIRLASEERLAIMCAEAVPWRCHRSLIADALLARGTGVEHILGIGPREPHRLTQGARVTEGRVSYPAAAHVRPLGE